MAEKVTAGSVPMATATSMRPEGWSRSATTWPPEVRAMMSTAARAEFVPGAAGLRPGRTAEAAVSTWFWAPRRA